MHLLCGRAPLRMGRPLSIGRHSRPVRVQLPDPRINVVVDSRELRMYERHSLDECAEPVQVDDDASHDTSRVRLVRTLLSVSE